MTMPDRNQLFRRHAARPRSRHRFVLMAALSCAGPALASDPAAAPPPQLAQFRAQSTPECTCRAKGQVFRIGDQVCLNGTSGSQMFRCAMDLNVTSWQPAGQPCPQS